MVLHFFEVVSAHLWLRPRRIDTNACFFGGLTRTTVVFAAVFVRMLPF